MKGTHFQQHILGGLTVIIAAFFYANFRSTTLLSGYLDFFHVDELNAIALPTWIHSHLPSFLQTLFIGYVLRSIKYSQNKPSTPAIGALLLASVLEFLQLLSFLPGTFDINDVTAVFLASLFIFLITPHASLNQKTHTIKHKKLLHTGLITSSFLLSMACMEEIDECNPTYSICVKPITLTWEELREDINPEYGNTAVITVPGKIHVKDKYLFIVDNYRGVHIFDQTDPQNPMRLVFIPIKGALDISVNNELMYVNSFTDLTIINYQLILDGNFDVTAISRKNLIFDIPSYYSFFPKGTYLEGKSDKYSDYYQPHNAEESKYPKSGFIIGYIDTDNQEVLYGEFTETSSNQTKGGM